MLASNFFEAAEKERNKTKQNGAADAGEEPAEQQLDKFAEYMTFNHRTFERALVIHMFNSGGRMQTIESP